MPTLHLKREINGVFCFLLAVIFCPLALAELKTGMDASVVVGQPNFTTNSTQPITNRTRAPYGVATDGKRLFVSESLGAQRILIWDPVPTQNFTPPTLVLGQPDFTSAAGGTTQRTLSVPSHILIAGSKLIVADYGNSRILIWNTLPNSNFAPADVVIGQPDFNSNAVNNGGVSARSLNGPNATYYDGKRFL